MKAAYRRSVIALFVFGVAVLPATAGIITFDATLTGANESPPNASPATGALVATLDDVANTLMVNETFSGLTAPASAAHIHGGAAAGANAPVALSFVGSGFPIGATSGSFVHTFDLTTSLSGGITLGQFITDLKSGLAYANIHDANFPGGEIRGQLEFTPVPEPATLLLLVLGISALAVTKRKRVRGV